MANWNNYWNYYRALIVLVCALLIGYTVVERLYAQSVPEPARIAINPFETAGAEKSLAVALKPFLKQELSSSPRIIVVEENRLDDALDYIKLQQSGLCNIDYCPVEPGKFLSAQKIVTGTISKLGSKYYFSLSLIDVQSLREEYTDTTNCVCAEEDLNQPIVFLGDRLRKYIETGKKPAKVTAPIYSAPPSDNSIITSPARSGGANIPYGQNCPADMVYVPDGHFCIDKYKAPNQKGAVPSKGLSLEAATSVCSNAGKRLPTKLEHQRACAGPNNNIYPYGPTYMQGKCRGWKMIDDPSGNYPECVSGYGMEDAGGPPFEYVSNGTNFKPFSSKLKNSTQCSASYSRVGKTYHQFFGVRCAMNASGSPPLH